MGSVKGIFVVLHFDKKKIDISFRETWCLELGLDFLIKGQKNINTNENGSGELIK